MALGSIGKKIPPPAKLFVAAAAQMVLQSWDVFAAAARANVGSDPDLVQPSRCVIAAMALQQGSAVRVVASGIAATQCVTRIVAPPDRPARRSSRR